MRLSKYRMLNSLGYNENNQISRSTKEVLNRYKLLGIVLHDPNHHREFDQRLDELFEMLDFITGNDFLFFCLLNPKKEWMERNRDRDYFNIWSKQELSSPRTAYSGNDLSNSTYGIAKSLGIDYEDLPVIILTNNFQFNQFHQIKTCANHLEEQMKEIGFFCSQKEIHFSLTEDKGLEELINKIDKCDGNELKTISNSLAKNVSDFLAFLIDGESKDFSLAQAQRADAINRFTSSKTFERDPKKLENLNLFMLSTISNFRNKNIQTDDFRFPVSGLEPESKTIYQTYYYLERNYDELFDELRMTHRHSGHIHQERQFLFRNRQNLDFRTPRVDYTPLTIALCKIFEIEINLSLVHWIRKYLEIEMPDYFNRRKRGGGNYRLSPSPEVINYPRPIDFNKGKKSKWVAPGIGESELIAKTLKDNNDFSSLTTDLNALISHWTTIRKNRNKVAHSLPASKRSYENVKNSFDTLMQSNLFSDLITVKRNLRTTANIV